MRVRVFVYMRHPECVCACVGGWFGLREKPALWFTHHSLCPAEILSFSGMIAFFFLFFWVHWGFLKYNFSGWGSQMGVTHMNIFFLLHARKSEWLMLFSGSNIEENTWLKNGILDLVSLFKCEVVLKIARIQVGFCIQHCEPYSGRRKCWGQILLCCKRLHTSPSSAVDSLSDLHVLYCSRSWQSLSTYCLNEIQDVSPSTMNPS